jgi:hypothetical protein
MYREIQQSIHTMPTTPSERIISRLQYEKNVNGNTRTYLAGLNRPDEYLTWIKDGSYERLVWKFDLAYATDTADVRNARLTMFVRITHDDFWMMSDAGWRGPTEDAPTFADITLTCTAAAPRWIGLDNDFDNALRNLKDIVRIAGEHPPSVAGLIMQEKEQRKIILRHSPFIVGRVSHLTRCQKLTLTRSLNKRPMEVHIEDIG